MPYGQSALRGHMQAGDPFLGGLVKGIGRFAGGAVKGFIGGGPIGALTGGIGAVTGRRRLPPMPGRQIPGILPGGIIPTQPRIGVSPTPAQRRLRRELGFPEDPRARKRPRMNPMNPKAARRAARRLDAYTREYKKIEKTLRKLAPPRRRSARRDLPPGHAHVR